MRGRVRITVDRQPWTQAIELRLGVEDENGNYDVATGLTMERAVEGNRVDPFVSLKPEVAQQLMDELWHAGIRPAQGEGSAGQAQAMQRHLDDMRTITFHALKVPK